MKEHLALLLRYENGPIKGYWNALKQLPAQDEKCLDLMSHILLVQKGLAFAYGERKPSAGMG